MIKIAIGILIGAIGVAIAKSEIPSTFAETSIGILNAGETPSHKAKFIQVDEDGYVIISTIRRPAN